jgi:hypothetical protein
MRRANDFYPTPAWATDLLLQQAGLCGDLCAELCCGNNDITRQLRASGRFSRVLTNDLDKTRDSDTHYDAARRMTYSRYADLGWAMPCWVVTNPPFNAAAQIVPLAYDFATIGIAMLLRLSFLEPVEDRGAWLNEHPPTSMIVLPRISFTGDGKTDSVTCAWMVWEKSKTGTITVAENPKFAKREHRQEAMSFA